MDLKISSEAKNIIKDNDMKFMGKFDAKGMAYILSKYNRDLQITNKGDIFTEAKLKKLNKYNSFENSKGKHSSLLIHIEENGFFMTTHTFYLYTNKPITKRTLHEQWMDTNESIFDIF